MPITELTLQDVVYSSTIFIQAIKMPHNRLTTSKARTIIRWTLKIKQTNLITWDNSMKLTLRTGPYLTVHLLKYNYDPIYKFRHSGALDTYMYLSNSWEQNTHSDIFKNKFHVLRYIRV